jgi:hypothetical protein
MSWESNCRIKIGEPVEVPAAEVAVCSACWHRSPAPDQSSSAKEQFVHQQEAEFFHFWLTPTNLRVHRLAGLPTRCTNHVALTNILANGLAGLPGLWPIRRGHPTHLLLFGKDTEPVDGEEGLPGGELEEQGGGLLPQGFHPAPRCSQFLSSLKPRGF